MNLTISSLWEKLKKVQTVTLRCEKESLWRGVGKVVVEFESNRTIVFHENGEWNGQNISFRNVLRWVFRSNDVSLEHLRFGPQAPLFLLTLIPIKDNRLDTMNPHLCQQDSYSAQVFWDQQGVHLVWKVQGPMKNEEIYSCYS